MTGWPGIVPVCGMAEAASRASDETHPGAAAHRFSPILSAKLVNSRTHGNTTVELNASRGETQHGFNIGSLVR